MGVCVPIIIRTVLQFRNRLADSWLEENWLLLPVDICNIENATQAVPNTGNETQKILVNLRNV